MNLITLKQASKLTHISVTTLRRRVQNNTLPALRTNAKTGRILFDLDQLVSHLQKEAASNVRNSGVWDDEQTDPSFDAYEDVARKAPTMATAHKLFGEITQDDVDSGRFAPDSLAFKPSDNPTSETLRAEKAPKKP